LVVVIFHELAEIRLYLLEGTAKLLPKRDCVEGVDRCLLIYAANDLDRSNIAGILVRRKAG